MSNKVGIKYPLEVKMKAIEMRQDGIPVKTIQEALNIKSESQSMLGGIGIVMATCIASSSPPGNNILSDMGLKELLKKKYS